MSQSADDTSSSNTSEQYNSDATTTVDSHLFPTLPAFTVPVEVKNAPQYGPNEFGVFAKEDIPAYSKDFWIWTDRVKQIHHTEIEN